MTNEEWLDAMDAEREEADRRCPMDAPEEWSELEWAQYEERCLACEGRGWFLLPGKLRECEACNGSGRALVPEHVARLCAEALGLEESDDRS